jgi:hypothetical protein
LFRLPFAPAASSMVEVPGVQLDAVLHADTMQEVE